MKNTFKIYAGLILALLLASCSTTKDFHLYQSDHSFKVKAEFDQVWEEVIDYVAESNYEITNLEKESGIITISPCRFKAAFQVKGMQNNNYYYAVQNYPKYKKKDLYVISNWNIRVKPINHYVTKISVNLLDNGRVIAIDDDKKQIELDLANQSTGMFEKKILYQILDNLRKRNFDEYDWRYYEGENH